LRIVKVVVNSHGSKALPGSFTLQVSRGGVEVAKGPLSAAGITLTLVPGTYVLSEMPETGYRGVWSGAITAGGTVTLVAGQDLTVTRTNYDIGTTVVSPVTTPVVPTPDPVVPTETGGKLPNTSTPWGNWMLLGTLLMLVGGFGFASRKILAK
jgi:LPXTG-motif cell wall-anchored protein